MFNTKAQNQDSMSWILVAVLGLGLLIVAVLYGPKIYHSLVEGGKSATDCNATYKGTCQPSSNDCGPDQVAQFPKIDEICSKDNPDAVCCVPAP